jgi:adenylate kinase
VLETKSQPLRQYLLENVVPILCEGLFEVCRDKPEDPVEQLAEFLFKRYADVPCPDPYDS